MPDCGPKRTASAAAPAALIMLAHPSLLASPGAVRLGLIGCPKQFGDVHDGQILALQVQVLA